MDNEYSIEQLNILKRVLVDRPEALVRELPADIRERVMANELLGTLTSSGLEKITSIIDRINWAIYYLSNPEHLEPSLDEQEAELTVATDTGSDFNSNHQTAKLNPTQSPATPPNNDKLDFGPFRPN